MGHDLGPHEMAIANYQHSGWRAVEDSNRLHQLAGALLCLRAPDPLLSRVVEEINRRPATHVSGKSKTVALYGLQAVRILSESGAVSVQELITVIHIITITDIYYYNC